MLLWNHQNCLCLPYSSNGGNLRTISTVKNRGSIKKIYCDHESKMLINLVRVQLCYYLHILFDICYYLNMLWLFNIPPISWHFSFVAGIQNSKIFQGRVLKYFWKERQILSHLWKDQSLLTYVTKSYQVLVLLMVVQTKVLLWNHQNPPGVFKCLPYLTTHNIYSWK